MSFRFKNIEKKSNYKNIKQDIKQDIKKDNGDLLMKVIASIILLSIAATVNAAPISPMQNYQYTDLSSMSEAKRVWRSMKTKIQRSSECFNRALAWVYDMDKQFNIKSRKLILHYSAKYNEELDSGWGFHIAPLLSVKGEDYVFDRQFMDEPIKRKDWVDHFIQNGLKELTKKRNKLVRKKKALKRKLREMYEELEENKEVVWFWDTPTSVKEKIKKIDDELEYLQVSETGPVTIKCKPITNIEELDYNLTKEWCYTQEVSMYYWGIPQLRLLNYGTTNVPPRNQLSYAHERGKEYVMTDWNMEQVWDARAEAFKSYKDQWKREWDYKEWLEEREEARERARRRRERGW